MSYTAYAEDDGYAEAEEDPYRASRLLLAAEYRDLPDEQVEDVLQATFPELDPHDAENLFRNVAGAFNTAGRELIRRAPAVISSAGKGAAAGASFGPYGALAGALGGAVLGGVGAPGPASPSAPAGPPSTVRPPVAPGAPAPAPSPGADGAPGRDLAALMARPQTALSVLTSLLGTSGRRTLPVGGGQIPVPAILAALSTLAARASEDLGGEEDDEEATAYLRDASGNFVVDPADPDARAAHMLRVLSEASHDPAGEDYGEGYEYDEAAGYDEDDESAGYDEDDEDIADYLEDVEDVEP